MRVHKLLFVLFSLSLWSCDSSDGWRRCETLINAGHDEIAECVLGQVQQQSEMPQILYSMTKYQLAIGATDEAKITIQKYLNFAGVLLDEGNRDEQTKDIVSHLASMSGFQADAGDLSGARETALAALKYVKPNDLEKDYMLGFYAGNALKTLVEVGEAATAITWANQVDEKERRRELLAGIASTQVNTGDLAGALITIDQFSYNIRMRDIKLGFVVRDVARTGKFSEALAVADRISDEFKRGSAAATIIRERFRLSDPDFKDQQLHEWLRPLSILVTGTNREKQKKFEQIMLSAAKGMAESGNTKEAAELLTDSSMTDQPKKRAELLLVIAGQQINIGDTQGVVGTLDEAAKEIIAIENEYWRNASREDLRKLLVLSGDIEKAISLRPYPEGKNSKDEMLYEIARWQMEAGNIEEASETTGRIADAKPFDLATTYLAIFQAKKQQFQQAIDTLDSLRNRNPSQPLWEISLEQAKAGDGNASLQTAIMIDVPEWRARATFAALIAQQKD